MVGTQRVDDGIKASQDYALAAHFAGEGVGTRLDHQIEVVVVLNIGLVATFDAICTTLDYVWNLYF